MTPCRVRAERHTPEHKASAERANEPKLDASLAGAEQLSDFGIHWDSTSARHTEERKVPAHSSQLTTHNSPLTSLLQDQPINYTILVFTSFCHNYNHFTANRSIDLFMIWSLVSVLHRPTAAPMKVSRHGYAIDNGDVA